MGGCEKKQKAGGICQNIKKPGASAKSYRNPLGIRKKIEKKVLRIAQTRAQW
jgi:hypothetical protein